MSDAFWRHWDPNRSQIRQYIFEANTDKEYKNETREMGGCPKEIVLDDLLLLRSSTLSEEILYESRSVEVGVGGNRWQALAEETVRG